MCLATASAALLVCGVARADDAPQLKIEARLFGSKTGKLSADVLGADGPPLGNVVMGDDASTSTFVVVHVAGPPLLPPETTVRLVAQEAPADGAPAKTILDQQTQVTAAAASKSDFYVGFWLPDTGCAPIKLEAALQTGGQADATATANLDFTCNE